MAAQERLINNLHQILRDDPYIMNICKSAGIEIDILETVLQDLYNQFWFDSMTWGADILAKKMNINFSDTLTQAEKNSLVEARFKNNGKSDIDLLQNIANSWKNGQTSISFINGKIVVKFIGQYGTPTDIAGLRSEISKAKPCHLDIEYLFRYLLVKDVSLMTISELQSHHINEFAF